MGFSGLSIATSGLRAAHVNLGVTGHNMANAEIRGFSRQRIVQKESMVIGRGLAPNGNQMVLGLGTDRNAVQQLRNEFLDFTFRHQVGRREFYATTVTVGREIESLLGELHGASNFQGVINDMWFAIQELTAHPDGFAQRQMLLSTANSFLIKAQEVYRGLHEYQLNLDQQVRAMVGEINELVARINELNGIIRFGEMAGDNANDFRDQRNLALDRLSALIQLDVVHAPNGDIHLFTGGHELLAGGRQNMMGLRFISDEFNFVEPVFTTATHILSAGTSPDQFVSFMNFHRGMGDQHGNDFGALNALIMARGMAPAHHLSHAVQHPQDRLIQLEANIDNVWNALDAAIPIGHALRGAFDAANADRSNAALRAALETTIGGSGYLGLQQLMGDLSTAESRFAHAETNLAADIHNFTAHQWSVQHGMIPQVQIALDRIVNSVVTMLNDALTGQLREPNPDYPSSTYPNMSPYRYVFFQTDADGNPILDANGNRLPRIPLDADGNPGIPLFERRFATTPGAPQDPNVFSTIYTIENLRINPALLQDGGHNLLALSLSGAPNDPDLLVGLHRIWRSNTGPYAVDIGGRHFSVQDAYIRLTNQIAIEVSEAARFVDAQTIQVIQADNQRNAVKGVSMDEELGHMLRFQYAFQAASRAINVIDAMIDQIINRTGRAGL